MSKLKDKIREMYTAEELRNIADQGCDGGAASGLIYYYETVKFYDEYADDLWELLNDGAETEDCENVMDFMAGWSRANISSNDGFKNAVVWYGVAAVAIELTSEPEE